MSLGRPLDGARTGHDQRTAQPHRGEEIRRWRSVPKAAASGLASGSALSPSTLFPVTVRVTLVKRVLRLPLKGEYFDAIKSGEKKEEYRLVSTYWWRRLQSMEYDEILLTRGYPPATSLSRHLTRPWRGCEMRFITHPHFGHKPVQVYAIKVNE
jgi:hypothetical protein